VSSNRTSAPSKELLLEVFGGPINRNGHFQVIEAKLPQQRQTE